MVDLTTYERPRTLERALELVSEPKAVVVCGGTDFYPERLYRPRHERIVDVSGIEELHDIVWDAGTLRIGAAATWTQVRSAELSSAFNGLRDAAREVGASQIQNAGTVVGNICTASPAGDGIPPLLTLDAQVELRSVRGLRVVSLSQFLLGYRTTDRREDELVTAIIIPEPVAGSRGSFVKFGQRSSLVISIAMVAALLELDDDHIKSVRVAVGACSPVATRLAGVEEILVGMRFDASGVREALNGVSLRELAPIDDVRATGSYRQRLVPGLIADAVVSCGGGHA